MAYKIAEVRKQHGWSQQVLAAAIGTSPQQLGRWELGKRDIRVGSLIKIADTLDVSLDELVGRVPEKPASTDGTEELAWIYDHLPEDAQAALMTIARLLQKHLG